MAVQFVYQFPSIAILDKDMEHQWDLVDWNAIPYLKYEVGPEYCEGFTDWIFNDDTAAYQHMISIAPDAQSFDANISTPEGTEQSSPALSSPSLCEAVPRQKEKRRAQNRASQRAFRRRQACYIHTLEQELEETRAKYNKLRKYFEQVKGAFYEVEKED
ncbi:hypothetical protein BKA64DRAFT_637926 [Cadophora sp. MPI-SDFR-AT-0126]|nr:hypothetical protein BKA64DRAFT_637926 [Leotiomycetes sp. MPI-SDFR-AT-0126]